jgi:hypothetical protein
VSFGIPLLATGQLQGVDGWLRSVLWESEVPGASTKEVGIEIHRLKARLVFEDGNTKIVQGVREIFEIVDGEKPTFDAHTTLETGKIVLIGRGMHSVDFEQSFLDRINNKYV